MIRELSQPQSLLLLPLSVRRRQPEGCNTGQTTSQKGRRAVMANLGVRIADYANIWRKRSRNRPKARLSKAIGHRQSGRERLMNSTGLP